MQATPATWRSLIEAGWNGSPSLKILCGGEALPAGARRQLLPRCAELWNMYGPTETTVWSTVHKVTDVADAPCPSAIPSPTPNSSCWMRIGISLPHGAIGELYIGGAGVARGYLRRAELTANASSTIRSIRTAPPLSHRRPGPLAARRQLWNVSAASTTRSRSAASASSWARSKRCLRATMQLLSAWWPRAIPATATKFWPPISKRGPAHRPTSPIFAIT